MGTVTSLSRAWTHRVGLLTGVRKHSASRRCGPRGPPAPSARARGVHSPCPHATGIAEFSCNSLRMVAVSFGDVSARLHCHALAFC